MMSVCCGRKGRLRELCYDIEGVQTAKECTFSCLQGQATLLIWYLGQSIRTCCVSVR
jgi:hypothetical protein